MNYEPSLKEMAALWNEGLGFIESRQIFCEEVDCLSAVDAYRFIENVCDIVGYKESEDAED